MRRLDGFLCGGRGAGERSEGHVDGGVECDGHGGEGGDGGEIVVEGECESLVEACAAVGVDEGGERFFGAGPEHPDEVFERALADEGADLRRERRRREDRLGLLHRASLLLQ